MKRHPEFPAFRPVYDVAGPPTNLSSAALTASHHTAALPVRGRSSAGDTLFLLPGPPQSAIHNGSVVRAHFEVVFESDALLMRSHRVGPLNYPPFPARPNAPVPPKDF